ncbi:c-type cytochrome [Persephonella sp.]
MKKVLISTLVFTIASFIPALAGDAEKKLMEWAKKKGCFTCHDLDKPKNSIPFRVIAKEYKGKPDAIDTLVKSIMFASFGKWQKIGPEKYGMKPRAIYMPRQRQVTKEEATEIVKLILSLDTSKIKVKK